MDLKLKKYLMKHYSITFFIALFSIVILIAYYRVQIQIEIGPIIDTFDFLANAMFFAGHGYGYTDLIRPPLLSFVTSIIFRLGLVSDTVIFYVDAIFFVFATIGLYLFFRIKYDVILSFLGGLLFCTFPIVLLFTGTGLSDIPSVALSIWALYTMVLAVKKNPRFFYLAFPLAMLAFLTRYPAVFIALPIFFYIFVNRARISAKHAIAGFLISILPLIIVLLFYYGQFGNPFHPFLSFYNTTQTAWSNSYVYYQPDSLYFLKNMLTYIGAGGLTILLLLVVSILIFPLRHFNILKSKLERVLKTKIDKSTKLKVLILAIIMIIFLLTFAKIHYIASEILILFIIILTYHILSKKKIKYLDYYFIFISWFMAFFIFHSVYTIKDDRYFITMAPALSLFLIYCFNEMKKLWIFNVKQKNLLHHTLALLIVVMLLVSAVEYINMIPNHESNYINKLENIKISSQWFIENEPLYKNKIIYSDQWPYFSYYLRTNVHQIPSSAALNSNNYKQYLKNADYYITTAKGLNLTEFEAIKEFGLITIYKKKKLGK